MDEDTQKRIVTQLNGKPVSKRWPGTKVYPRKDLDEIDRHILAIMLRNPRLTDKEIAAEIGAERKSVFYRRRNPVFIEALEEHQKDALRVLSDAANRAAKRLVKALANVDDAKALPAAIKILEWAIGKPKQDVAVTHKISAEHIRWETVSREQRQAILAGGDPLSVLDESQIIH